MAGRVSCRVLVCLLLLSALCFAQTAKRPFTFEDMMKLKRVEDPFLSADGKWAAFAVTDVSLEENKKTKHIWIVAVDGSKPATQLTKGKGEDNPRFSPDGKKMLFISAPDGQSQVYTQAFDGAAGQLTGEPKKVTTISTEASAAMWSPDSKSILFVSSVNPFCALKTTQPREKNTLGLVITGASPTEQEACNKSWLEERAQSKVKAQIFTTLLYRHWNAYREGTSHLFLIPSEGGEARDLTPGGHDVPPFSLGGQDQYDISPDGKEIAYASNIEEVEATSTNTDIFVVSVKGGEAKKISTAKGADSTPRYSPDGKYIAFRSQERAGYESDRFRLMLFERASGRTTELTKDHDFWVDSIAWAPDSKSIYWSAEFAGSKPIFQSELTSPARPIIAGYNDSVVITPDGKTLVFTRMSLGAPNEIYTAKYQTYPKGTVGGFSGLTLDCGVAYEYPAKNPPAMVEALRGVRCLEYPSDDPQVKPLTSINAEVLSQVHMSPIESFWFTGSENAKVQGFIVRPPNFDASKKYPVKLLIHGGPQGAWGDDWSYRWNPELFAANGYVVVMINPRGSTGYGQKFIDDINGDWGGRAYQDIMLGMDYAEQKYPFIDKNRECALGASYGGYMVFWIAGNTQRFKCLVAHDGQFNPEAAYGTTEELWFPEWEFKGTPWNSDLYRKWSPMLKAQNFKTPMLVVHGQLDYRLDVSEGFQAFTALQKMGVPSKMLYFPDEGHWVLKPQNSQLWYKTVNDWVDEWVNPDFSRPKTHIGLVPPSEIKLKGQ